jgi:general secretion pathway protein I
LSKSHGDRAHSGFTLVEVIVALAIAGLGLALMIAAAGAGLGNAGEADRYIDATRRAQAHLAALGVTTTLRPGEQSGDDGGGYSWRVRVSEPVLHASDAQAAKVLGLYTVEVTISWRDARSSRNVSLLSQRLVQVASQ